MGHEDAVYLAKLAEQAERYEGKWFYMLFLRLRFRVKSNVMFFPQRWSRT